MDDIDKMSLESAFPNSGYYVSAGMSLRDWFAGMIACGVFANPNVNLALINKEPENFNIAIFKCADAMLKEREK